MNFSSYVLQCYLADGNAACRSFFTEQAVLNSANIIMLYSTILAGQLGVHFITNGLWGLAVHQIVYTFLSLILPLLILH